jgi:serine/threonine protein kinase/Flp pilus assembly protein TadD
MAGTRGPAVKSEKWKRVELVFSTAIEMDGSERGDYVETVCTGDPWLFEEVNSLIDAFENRSGFIEDQGFDFGLRVLGTGPARFEQGRMIGRYRIDRLLGEGGMGDVYLAQDTGLRREVALKFLNSASIDDGSARRKVTKEARAAASLRHPNICIVHGVEEIENYHVIVMEYIEGETLAERIASGSFRSVEFMMVAVQIVDAITAAHEHGIIHCDIKPGNIIVMPDGRIKVLDFGLAKILNETADGNLLLETISIGPQNGLIQGTVAYMSPEQTRGESLDARTDIFSVGTLLFELLSGVNPFSQKSQIETMLAIADKRSPLKGEHRKKIPARFRPVLRKCLETDRERRYPSADLLLEALRNLSLINRFPASLAASILAMFLVVMLLTLGSYLYLTTGRQHLTAILPFNNETSDTGVDYLADGITEGLINKLSDVKILKTTPYTMVSGYRGSDIDRIAVGNSLGVDLVMTGRVHRRDGILVIHSDVVDVRRGAIVQSWDDEITEDDALSYEVHMTNRLISLYTSGGQQDRSIHRGATTENNEAFQQFILGRSYWKKRDEKNLKLAIEAFQKAIDLDPSYARPWAGLADSYVLMSLAAYGGLSTKESMTKAKAAARQALEIDPYNAEAHTSLGIILTKYEWDWPEAERELRMAVEMNGEYAAAHYWLSDLLAVTGHPAESVAEAERARDLDPFSQQAEMNYARTLYYARNYDGALAVLSNAAGSENVDKKIKFMTGLIYIQKGMYDQAVDIFKNISAGDKLFAAAELGYAYGKLGKRKEAVEIIEHLTKTSGGRLPTEELAFIYTALGEKDEAFRCLNDALKNRHAVMIGLKADPMFDPLRDDPRYTELLKKMSL